MDCVLTQEILAERIKVLAVIEKAKPKQIPIRIGVNAGSLPKAYPRCSWRVILQQMVW